MAQGEPSNLSKLVRIFVDQLQLAEDARNDVYLQRWLDNAVGEQLDGLGDIVGESRAGRSDADYRNAIVYRVFLNSGNGEPETIISAVREFTGSTDIHYRELHPAKVYVNFTGGTVPSGLYSNVKSLLPAGVGFELVQATDTDPFIFTGQGIVIPDTQGLGFSDTNQVAGGKIGRLVV